MAELEEDELEELGNVASELGARCVWDASARLRRKGLGVSLSKREHGVTPIGSAKDDFCRASAHI
eukprot:3954928-Pleurochrysis_carterae.AAC.1